MELKASYTNKEIKEAIRATIKATKDLRKWGKNSEFDPLDSARRGSIWTRLTPAQKKMVEEGLSGISGKNAL